MGRLTQTLYLAWLAQNGASKPSRSTRGGMGVVTPMEAQNSPSKPCGRVDSPTPARDLAARPAKLSSNIRE